VVDFSQKNEDSDALDSQEKGDESSDVEMLKDSKSMIRQELSE